MSGGNGSPNPTGESGGTPPGSEEALPGPGPDPAVAEGGVDETLPGPAAALEASRARRRTRRSQETAAVDELARGLSVPLAGAAPVEEEADLEPVLEAGALDSEVEFLRDPAAPISDKAGEPPAAPKAGEPPAAPKAGEPPAAPKAGEPEEPPPPARRCAVLEALLFASAVPVRAVDLQEACGWPLGLVNRDLERLALELAGRGLELQKVAGAWRLVTAAETAPWVERFLKVQSRKQLSRSQLETLAVIAYRQPVTRAEVDAYRGVRSERTLHQLGELRLIREVGRAEMPGRPIQYGTTSDFLRYFSLDRLEDLPVVERGSVHFRRHRGPFRSERPAAGNADSGGAPEVPEVPEVEEVPVPPEPEEAPAEGEEPGGLSQSLRRLLDKVRRRSERESREQPAVRPPRKTSGEAPDEEEPPAG